jgi:hypothetical protein
MNFCGLCGKQAPTSEKRLCYWTRLVLGCDKRLMYYCSRCWL